MFTECGRHFCKNALSDNCILLGSPNTTFFFFFFFFFNACNNGRDILYNTGVVTSILKLIVRIVLWISLGSHLWKRYQVNKLLAFNQNADAKKNLLIYRFDFVFAFYF